MKPLNLIFPEKLKVGDEARIIAPALSLKIIAPENREIANKRLEGLGLKLSFGKHVEEADILSSSSIESRVEDLHEAFKDKNVKIILSVIGGFNANQLLKYLDYDLIKNNPKIICGYSDITALTNAIFAKTGLVTYSAPSYSTFGRERYFDYCLEYFEKCLFQNQPFEVKPSEQWDDSKWPEDQGDIKLITNQGPWLINEGEVEGTIVGGNLCTLNLLQGTEYFPSLQDSILFIEDDEGSYPELFDRDLQSLIHQPSFAGVKGIIIGRFQEASKMTKEKLIYIIKTKKELNKIPVAADFDFGHTSPMFTFPIGGRVKLSALNSGINLQIKTF